jgi:hypothetical protein
MTSRYQLFVIPLGPNPKNKFNLGRTSWSKSWFQNYLPSKTQLSGQGLFTYFKNHVTFQKVRNLAESESESAYFSEVRVRKFRTLKTHRTRTQRVCLFATKCWNACTCIREFKTTEKAELVLKTYQMNNNVFSENKRFTDWWFWVKV